MTKTRRDFLLDGLRLTLILPAGVSLTRVLTGCGGYGDDAGDGESGDGLVFTSSRDSGHTHTFRLTEEELSAPPSDGLARATSTSGGHTHEVELSNEQLTAIAAGDTVVVEAGSASGHTHTFTFVRS